MHGIAPDMIDDDERQGGHHQFARALFLACTSTVWKTLQGGWRVADFAYQARSSFGWQPHCRNLYQTPVAA